MRRSYRLHGKVKHETVGNLSDLPADVIGFIKQRLDGELDANAPHSPFEISRSLPHGNVMAVLETARGLGLEEIEDILDRLNEVNWVGSVGGSDWTLTRSAEAIRLADVYRVFVFDLDQHCAALGIAGAREAVLLAGLTARMDEVLSLSLKDLFSSG